jgi:hypothetical protein
MRSPTNARRLGEAVLHATDPFQINRLEGCWSLRPNMDLILRSLIRVRGG